MHPSPLKHSPIFWPGLFFIANLIALLLTWTFDTPKLVDLFGFFAILGLFIVVFKDSPQDRANFERAMQIPDATDTATDHESTTNNTDHTFHTQQRKHWLTVLVIGVLFALVFGSLWQPLN